MNKNYIIFAVLLILTVFLGTIFNRPLFIEDETRYAEIAREMIESGDFISPTLNGLDYFEKPIMGHWLNAGAMMIFGENGFSVRFFPALCTLLTGLMLFFWVKKTFKNRETAQLAALIYFSSALTFAVGTYGVLDSQFSFFVAAALFFGYLAIESETVKKSIFFFFLCGIALGGGFLVKGFVAAVLVGLPLGGYILWQKKWKQAFLSPWIPLAVATIVVLPWGMAIHRRSPDFWNYFFWIEHIQRFLGDARSQHPEGAWYFLILLPVLAMPWALFYPAVFAGFMGGWKRAFSAPEMKFSACMIMFPFLFLSACSGKLATYILPIFPALSVITAVGLQLYFAKENERKWVDKVANLLTKALLFLLIGFIVFQALAFIRVIPEQYRLYAPNEKMIYFIAMLGAIGLMASFKQIPKYKELMPKCFFLFIGTSMVMLTVHFIIPQRILLPLSPEVFYAPYIENITPETKVVAFKKLIGGACWVLKRSDVMVYENGGELTYGIEHSDEKRLLTPDEFRDLTYDKSNHIVIMMDSERRQKQLPPSPIKVWQNNLLYQEYNN